MCEFLLSVCGFTLAQLIIAAGLHLALDPAMIFVPVFSFSFSFFFVCLFVVLFVFDSHNGSRLHILCFMLALTLCYFLSLVTL